MSTGFCHFILVATPVVASLTAIFSSLCRLQMGTSTDELVNERAYCTAKFCHLPAVEAAPQSTAIGAEPLLPTSPIGVYTLSASQRLHMLAGIGHRRGDIMTPPSPSRQHLHNPVSTSPYNLTCPGLFCLAVSVPDLIRLVTSTTTAPRRNVEAN